MHCSYVAQGRPDLGHAVTILARAMKQPNEADWEALKRVGRYLKGPPFGVWSSTHSRFRIAWRPFATQTTPGTRSVVRADRVWLSSGVGISLSTGVQPSRL